MILEQNVDCFVNVFTVSVDEVEIRDFRGVANSGIFDFSKL